MNITFKPWGNEKICEQNENYVLKLLTMYKGHRCSLQFHQHKHETIFVVSGILQIYKDTSVILCRQGDYLAIPPKTIHRMEAIVDSQYLEASTPHLDDVVRLEDNYNRI